jgi:acetyltransferase
LEYLKSDNDIKMIALHIEGLRDGQRFLEVASQITKEKPVIAVKSGKSDYGAKAMQSHTGSIMGKDETYDAAFKQCGIIRVEDMEELEDLARAFLTLPPVKGRRVAIMAWAGSTGIFTLDACEQYGLQVAELSPNTINKIRDFFQPPTWLSTTNPIDIWAHITLKGFEPPNFRKELKIIMEALLADDNVDAVVAVIIDYLDMLKSELFDISPEVIETIDSFKDKPLVFAMPSRRGELAKKIDESGKTIVFPSCERAVKCLSRLAQYFEYKYDRSF